MKRVHGATAQNLIGLIGREVGAANSSPFRVRDDWRIVKPDFFALTLEVIAMSVTGKPSAAEMISIPGSKDRIKKVTPRGKKVLKELLRRHPSVSVERFSAVCGDIHAHTYLHPGNLVFLGYKKGQFLFAPYADYEFVMY